MFSGQPSLGGQACLDLSHELGEAVLWFLDSQIHSLYLWGPGPHHLSPRGSCEDMATAALTDKPRKERKRPAL